MSFFPPSRLASIPRLIICICAFWIVAQSLLTISFTAKHWNLKWPAPILTIDGNSYVEGARKFALGNGISDIYHSPGYQAFLGTIWFFSGSIEETNKWSKCINVFLFFATIVMVWKGGRRWFRPETCAIAAAILSTSLSMRFYANMLQYEVLTAFLIVSWILLITKKYHNKFLWYAGDFASAIVLSMILWIQIRYFLLLFIPFFLHFAKDLKRSRISTCIRALLPLLFVICWSAFISIRAGDFIFVMEGSEFRFKVGNNINATGVSYPYPKIIEPSGWDFIVTRPGHFLWLVGQRFLYLWGILRDLWGIPPAEVRPWMDIYLYTSTCVLFFFGWLLKMSCTIKKTPLFPSETALHGTLLIVLFTPLAIFGSHRFILPVLPFICLFQAYAIERVWLLIRQQKC